MFNKILPGIILGILANTNAAEKPGLARSESRIVDGVNVTPVNKYPMVVAIFEAGNFLCQGTILSKNFILTQVDCADFFDPDAPHRFQVKAGIYSVGDPNGKYVQTIPVKSVTKHVRVRDKTKGTYSNDIAVIRLSRPVVWNNYVAPTNLPDPGWNVMTNGEINLIAVAWGYGRNGTFPHAPTRPLQEIALPMLTTEDCQRELWYQSSITDDIACIKAVGGAGACYADQGGPAFIYNEANDKHTQIGIFSTSWKECGTDADFVHASIWTKVSKFIHWINEGIRECNPPRVF